MVVFVAENRLFVNPANFCTVSTVTKTGPSKVRSTRIIFSVYAILNIRLAILVEGKERHNGKSDHSEDRDN